MRLLNWRAPTQRAPQTILEEIGCQLREFAWPDRWYYGKQQRMTDASVTVWRWWCGVHDRYSMAMCRTQASSACMPPWNASATCPNHQLGRMRALHTGSLGSPASTPRTLLHLCFGGIHTKTNLTHRAIAAADACYANDFGCGLHQLGVTEMIIENSRWDSGMMCCFHVFGICVILSFIQVHYAAHICM